MIVIDAGVADVVDVDQADPEMRNGFVPAVGWNPADEGPGRRFFRRRPCVCRATAATGRVARSRRHARRNRRRHDERQPMRRIRRAVCQPLVLNF